MSYGMQFVFKSSSQDSQEIPPPIGYSTPSSMKGSDQVKPNGPQNTYNKSLDRLDQNLQLPTNKPFYFKFKDEIKQSKPPPPLNKSSYYKSMDQTKPSNFINQHFSAANETISSQKSKNPLQDWRQFKTMNDNETFTNGRKRHRLSNHKNKQESLHQPNTGGVTFHIRYTS